MNDRRRRGLAVVGFVVAAALVAVAVGQWSRATTGALSSSAPRLVDEARVEPVLRGRPWGALPPLTRLESYIQNYNHGGESGTSSFFGPFRVGSHTSSGMASWSSSETVTLPGREPWVSCGRGGGPSEYVVSSHLVFRQSLDRHAIQFRCEFDHVPDGVTLDAARRAQCMEEHAVPSLSAVFDRAALRPLVLGHRATPAWFSAKQRAAVRRLRLSLLALGAAVVEALALARLVARGLRRRPRPADPVPYRGAPVEAPLAAIDAVWLRWHWVAASLLATVAALLARGGAAP